MTTKRLLTIEEAAERLGLKPSSVRQYVKEGTIKSVKIGTRITPAAIAEYENKRQPRGRPATKKGRGE